MYFISHGKSGIPPSDGLTQKCFCTQLLKRPFSKPVHPQIMKYQGCRQAEWFLFALSLS